jgi:hypothetical protein
MLSMRLVQRLKFQVTEQEWMEERKQKWARQPRYALWLSYHVHIVMDGVGDNFIHCHLALLVL